jgi:hypothetical protein
MEIYFFICRDKAGQNPPRVVAPIEEDMQRQPKRYLLQFYFFASTVEQNIKQ